MNLNAPTASASIFSFSLSPIHIAKICTVAYNDSMRILTAAEMRACDERTALEQDQSLHQLMERAGEAVARFVLLQYPLARRITILCGKGNNGGDGMVAARYLIAEGRQVVTILLAEPGQLQGAARRACDQLAENPLVVTSEADFAREEIRAHFTQTDVFLDAIFGTGFRPPLQGLPLAVREALKQSSAPVLAVDLPSGWDADATGFQMQPVVRADSVLTFTAPKLAHVFGALTGVSKRGPIAVAPIGSPDTAILSSAGLHWTGAAKRIVEQPRRLDANKG